MAWLPDSLRAPSTELGRLRGAGHPYTMQDSLTVVGQALPDGIPTRRGSAERFQPQLLIDFPLSRASWRNERLPMITPVG